VPGVGPQVQIGGDLGDDVVDGFQDSRPRLPVTGDAEPVEHPLAETVRRGDRGRVEVGQCDGEPAAPLGNVLIRTGGQVP
jgi:hypothetical protein